MPRAASGSYVKGKAMEFLTSRRERTKIWKVDSEPNDETDESTNQNTSDTSEKTPPFKLRDLRPEKDPMGAGGRRAPNAATDRFLC